MKKFLNKYFIVLIIVIITVGEIFYKKTRYVEVNGVSKHKSWRWSLGIKKKFSEATKVFFLKEENEKLKEENSRLHEVILNKNISTNKCENDFLYRVFSAQVVANSIAFSKNFLILNKGNKDGINIGMGVFTSLSPVGIVIDTSENFSLVASILNRDLWLSAKLKKSQYVGSIRWEKTGDPTQVTLIISKHAEIKIGDDVVTSGYSESFPPNLKIGKVKSIKIKGDQPSYEVEVQLNEKIGALSFVYIVDYKKQAEKNSIAARVMNSRV